MTRVNRREVLKSAIQTTALAAAAAHSLSSNLFAADGGTSKAPTVITKKNRVLRVLGTHVTLQNELRLRAQQDLGITLEFTPGGSAEVLHKASTRPESFDLYEQWSDSMRILWQAGAIQAIDIHRLTYWEEINNLTKTGLLTPNAKRGAGDRPNDLLFVQDDGSIGNSATDRVSFLPYVHNCDSFGYNAAEVPRGTPYETESWTWLLDDQWKGRVAIVNVPTIGLFDLALATQNKGLVTFGDIGNMTRDELDRLFDVLVEYRQNGHFRGVWSSVPASVQMMQRGEVCIESMFSPAVFDLQAQGVDCVYASPREGYRAWHGVMCLSSRTDGVMKDIAYEYMNWWLSGWPGAFIARQGYYISNPERSRPEMSEDEWNYWYLGEPAAADLLGTNGQVVVQKGLVRDGGSYETRLSNVAVWNTVMDTYEYSLQKWNEFLSS